MPISSYDACAAWKQAQDEFMAMQRLHAEAHKLPATLGGPDQTALAEEIEVKRRDCERLLDLAIQALKQK